MITFVNPLDLAQQQISNCLTSHGQTDEKLFEVGKYLTYFSTYRLTVQIFFGKEMEILAAARRGSAAGAIPGSIEKQEDSI